MVLKIFTSVEARNANEQRYAQDSLRAQTLIRTTNELLKTRNEAETDFEETIKRQQEITEREFVAKIERNNQLERETIALEERKKKALTPLIAREKLVHSQEEALHEEENQLLLREVENEERTRLLMEKLDDLSTQQQDLNKRVKQLRLKEQGAETQSHQIAEQVRMFNRKLIDFQAKVEGKETEFAFRQSELDARKNLYDGNDTRLKTREQAMRVAQQQLAQERFLLDKGFGELRKQHV